MAKSKSKKTHKIKGAKAVPCGDEPPDPRYQLDQWQKAKERYERRCWQNYDELQALAGQPDIHKQFYELADKGFKEAQKRKEDQRWPLFDSDNKADVSKDLPQVACILLMFNDVFQELQGLADYEDALITPELRVGYSEAISELREQIDDYQEAEQEIDLFTICMVHVKKHFGDTELQETTITSDVDDKKKEKNGSRISDIVETKKLSQSHLRAYQSYKYAEETEPELKGVNFQKIYQWLKDPENKSDEKHPYHDFDIPKQDTWARYIRIVQKIYGTQRNQPRAGRDHGSSIVSIDESDYQSSQEPD